MTCVKCRRFQFRTSVGAFWSIILFNRLQNFKPEIFGDSFIDYLFDLVEQTKYMHDETFNYSVIKLIVGSFSLSK